MKSKFFFFITIIISACIIIASYTYWKSTVNKANEEVAVESAEVDKSDEKKTDKKKESENTEEKENNSTNVPVADKNETITAKVEERLSADEPLRFLFIGSERMTSDANKLPDVFANVMDEEIASLIEVDQFLFTDDATLISVVNDEELSAVNKEDYDFVILEPFTYSNHGLISYEDTEFYLNEFLNSWEDSDAVVIVHPAAKVTSLSFGAERHDHITDVMSDRPEIFIDIWEEDEEAVNELVSESGAPTDEGLDYWATQLASYFVQIGEGSNS